MIGVALVAVSWGAVAFGAVYPWGYWPLFAAASLAGAAGLLGAVRTGTLRHGLLMLAACAVALSVGIQLAPLPAEVINRLSPSADAILRNYDLGYAAGVTSHHALSIDPAATWRALVALMALVVFIVGLGQTLSQRGVAGVANAVAGLGFALALVAIVQHASGTDRIYGFWRPEHQPFHIFGPFVNRNHFAGWMIMALSLALGALGATMSKAMRGVRPDWRSRVLWLSTREANSVVLLTFACAVMALALVLTRSRSGIICFGVTLALTSWFVIRERQQPRRWRSLAVAYLSLLAIGALGWAGLDPIVRRFGSEAALLGRLTVWGIAIDIARDFYAAGTGLNTFGTAVIFYGPSLGAHWGAVHNDYLQLVSDGGLLVTVPVLVSAVLLAREISRRLRDGGEDHASRWIRVGAVTGIAAMALQESVDFSLQIPGVAVLFALLCAVAIHGVPKRARQSPMLAGPHPRPPTPSRRSARRNFHMRPFGSRRCFARGAPPPLADAFAPQRSA